MRALGNISPYVYELLDWGDIIPLPRDLLCGANNSGGMVTRNAFYSRQTVFYPSSFDMDSVRGLVCQIK